MFPGGGGGFLVFSVLYLTLLHLPNTQIPLCRRMRGWNPEPAFVNFQGAQEVIPSAYESWRNRFLRIDSWAP